jgi:hypothetical protein
VVLNGMVSVPVGDHYPERGLPFHREDLAMALGQVEAGRGLSSTALAAAVLELALARCPQTCLETL